MAKKDCYFFMNKKDEEDENGVISTCCIDCMNDKKIENSMFWPGSKKGYGPYKYVCHFCANVIHDNEAK
jgi:hypothetical protein